MEKSKNNLQVHIIIVISRHPNKGIISTNKQSIMRFLVPRKDKKIVILLKT